MSLLATINAQMNGGKCPTEGCIGECAIIHDGPPYPNQKPFYEAHLYIWRDDFNDSTTVAGWFKEAGADEVWIQHTLYSDMNDDRDGRQQGCRHWVVTFNLKDQTTRSPEERAILAVTCTKCGHTSQVDELLDGETCPRCRLVLH